MKVGKIYIEYVDGLNFLKDNIPCGSEGFLLTDDKGNRIWVWIKDKEGDNK